MAVVLVSTVLSAFAVYLGITGIAALWFRGARGGKAAALAILFALLPLAAITYGAANYVNLPPIYDVTTDLGNPPQWLDVPAADQSWLGERPEVTSADRTIQSLQWRDLTGRRYEGALDRVYTAARKVAIAQGLSIRFERGAPDNGLQELPPSQPGKQDDAAVPDALDVIPVPIPRPENQEPEDNGLPPGDPSIQGEVRTFLFGFRQDVVIRLREETETTLVDVRVASRYGDRDLGAGVAFIERYLRALDAELLGIAGG
jgi:hypothetical protein